MWHYDHITAWYIGLQEHILSQPHLTPLRQVFPAHPAQLTDIYFGRRMHMKAMGWLAVSLDKNAETLAIGAIDEYVRQRLGVPSCGLVRNPEVVEAARKLSERGYLAMPSIDEETSAEMRAYFEDEAVYRGNDPIDAELCSKDEARDANFAKYPTKTVLGCPHLIEIATDPMILSVVEQHLGTVPTTLNFVTWWSFAGRSRAEEAQLFHFDLDDSRFVKMFIYLTDVDEHSGPHAYIEGSHDTEVLGAVRREWPGGEGAFNDWYFSTHRKSDEDTHRFFPAKPAYLTGPAGSRFVVNTRGVHKGLLPERHDRLIVQVLYGITPMLPIQILQERWQRLQIGTRECRHVPDWVATTRPFNYVNRLYVEPAGGPR